MATRAHDCIKKGGATICPSCGRIAPDWCAEDQPTDLKPQEVIPTGSDLPASIAEVAAVAKAEAAIEAEQADAAVKVFKGLRGRKAL